MIPHTLLHAVGLAARLSDGLLDDPDRERRAGGDRRAEPREGALERRGFSYHEGIAAALFGDDAELD